MTAEQERAAVVAYLMAQAGTFPAWREYAVVMMPRLVAAIERGEHLPPPPE